jgi:hypothetical protein
MFVGLSAHLNRVPKVLRRNKNPCETYDTLQSVSKKIGCCGKTPFYRAVAVKVAAAAELMAIAATTMAVTMAVTMGVIAGAATTATVAGSKDSGGNSNGEGTDNNQLKAAAKT